MRIGFEPLLRITDADLVEQLQHPLARLAPAHAAVHVKDFADLPLHGMQRIERRNRLLEDHRDFVAAHLPQHLFVRRQQLLALIDDRAGRMVRLRIGQQFQDRQGGDRLAGPRFADQRDGLLVVNVEGNAAHRMGDILAHAEIDMQVVDGKDRFAVHATAVIVPGLPVVSASSGQVSYSISTVA